MSNSEKDNLKSMIKYLNQSLLSFGFSPMGQLHGPDSEIQKTVNSVWELIQQRQRDIQFRSQVIQRMGKLESDLNIFRMKSEKLKQQNDLVLKRLGGAENKHIQNEGELKI